MEIKATLDKPFTFEQKRDFIVTQNHNLGYEIKETELALEAWGYTQEEIEELERQRKDLMTLTPADVERNLYAKFGIDFNDLKELIATKLTGVDLKALNIEFNASLFYRGAKFGNNRLFDVIGNLLDLTPDEIDFLFEFKHFPENIENE